MGMMINQLRDAVRGATQDVDPKGNPVQRVIVLPHLDLLTTSQGGLTGEAREVIACSTRTRNSSGSASRTHRSRCRA